MGEEALRWQAQGQVENQSLELVDPEFQFCTLSVIIAISLACGLKIMAVFWGS